MRKMHVLSIGTAIGVYAFLLASLAVLSAAQPATQTVAVDNDDLGGVVTGPNGAEAGVWVIAETTDLPTRFVRIVVTDDQGRYVLPDLPKATYQIFVRGYGLLDSTRVSGRPGQRVNVTVVTATSER